MTHIKVTRKTIYDENGSREVFQIFHGIRWLFSMKWYRDSGYLDIDGVMNYLKPWIGCSHVKIHVVGVEN